MSEKENEFIKQLRKFMITLILVMVPFMLTSIGNMVNDHFKIKTNQQAIRAIKDSYVSNDFLILYVNQFSKANELFQEALETQDERVREELKEVHKQMDDLIRDVYKSTKRGVVTKNR